MCDVIILAIVEEEELLWITKPIPHVSLSLLKKGDKTSCQK